MPRRTIRAAVAVLCSLAMVLAVLAATAAPAASASTTLAWGTASPVFTTSATGVSCTSSTFCMAVSSGGTVGFYNGTTWVYNGFFNGGDLTGVSCTSSSFCMLVDNAGAFITYNGSAFSIAALVASGEHPSNVTCVSATSCFVGMTSGNIYDWNGTTWVLNDIGFSRPTVALSCPSSSFCATVNSGILYTSTVPSPGSWRTAQTLGSTNLGLVGVSCASSSFCVAIDSSGTAYVGAPGSMTSTTLTSTGTLASLSCASATFCVVGGSGGNVYTYDGSSWTSAQNIDGSAGSTAVSCPTSTFCADVDTGGAALVDAPVPLSFSPGTLPTALPGSTYAATLSATGGESPYTYSATGLPSWLTLSAAGVLSGIVPHSATTLSGVSVTATDAAAATASATISVPVGTPTPGEVATFADKPGNNGATTSGTPAYEASMAVNATAIGSNGLGIFFAGSWGVDFVPYASGTYQGQSMIGGDAYVVADQSGASGTAPGPALSTNMGAVFGIATSLGGYAVAGFNGLYYVPFSSGTHFGISMTALDAYLVDPSITSPQAVAFDSAGNLFVSTGHTIVMIAATSGTYFGRTISADTPTIVAGNGQSGALTAGGSATSSAFYSIAQLAVGPNDTLLFAPGGQLVAVASLPGTYFGTKMTVGDVYVVANGFGINGLAVDDHGNAYLSNISANRIEFVANSACSSSCPWGLSSAAAGSTSTIAPATYGPYGLSYNNVTGDLFSSTTGGGTTYIEFGGPLNAAPAFTSSASAGCAVGGACSFTVVTSGAPTPLISEAGGLPAGMSFTANGDGTATISGTPTALGAHQLTLTARGAGTAVTQSFTLTVGQVPTITSARAASFTSGQAGSFTITATGSPVPSITESGALASGVTFSGGNGTATLSGTPTSTGTYPITVTASNAAGTATQDLTVTVGPGAAPSASSGSSPTGPGAPAQAAGVPTPTRPAIAVLHFPRGFGATATASVRSSRPSSLRVAVTPTIAAALSVPLGALASGAVVAIGQRTGSASADPRLPAVFSRAATLAVSWATPTGRAPAPRKAISLSLSGKALRPGEIIYVVTAAGLRAVGTVGTGGRATVAVGAPGDEYVLAAPPVTRAPDAVAEHAPKVAMLRIGCVSGALCEGPAVLSVARRAAGARMAHPAVAVARVRIARGRAPVVRFSLTRFGRALVRAHQGKAFDVTLLVSTYRGNRLVRRIVLR